TNDEVERTVHGTVPTVDEEGTEGSKEIDFTFSEVGQSELTVTYKMNDEEVKTFYPKKTCINGKHILTLFLPITQVIANSENTLAVYFKIAGGTLTIGESQIRATISGQGLVAGIGDWNGRISISETIDRVPIAQTTFGYDAFIDTAAIVFPRIVLRLITQPLTRIPIMESEFTYHRLNERVTAVEVIKTFTMDKDFPPHYDQTVVELNEDSAFCMISDYSFVSSAEEINAGQLQHLTVDTEPFERVERLEVTTC
ncbi:MAG: hypothetical protein PHE63_12345, partial [Eubacteriales bacterium]|nr:hypothetical protein [Eubacteriales bacterium]